MEELYELLESKIKASGYPGEISGRDFYEDISDEVEDRENGSYLFVIKKTDTIIYEGCMDIMDNEFDLHYVDIREGEQSWHVDFDE